MMGYKTFQICSYSRFQVTFQSPVPKFVSNIPNYITKFGILLWICKAKFACWWMKYGSTELKPAAHESYLLS